MASRHINARQIALLHVARAQLGLDEDLYRLILEQEAKVTSAKDLTQAGFDRVMRRFRTLGFRRRPAVKPQHDAQATITRAQQAKLDELYNELGWTDVKRRNGFARRQLGGKPWPQTRADANKIIEGLKAMIAREKRGDGGGRSSGTMAE